MTVSKMKNWIKEKWANVQQVGSKIRFKSLTGKIDAILSNKKSNSTAALEPASQTIAKSYPSSTENTAMQRPVGLMSRIRDYRIQIAKGVGAFGLLAGITVGGNYYVQMNTLDVYDVYMKDVQVGTVSDPQLVEDLKLEKYKKLEQNSQDVHMVLNTNDITLRHERAFKKPFDNEETLRKLDELLVPEAVGVQVKVDGDPVAIVKDKDTAEEVLQRIMSKYTGEQKKESGEVTALSAEPEDSDLAPGQSELQEASFLQNVDLVTMKVEPEQVMNPDEVQATLETGNATPTMYTVVKGDCVSCIAHRFKISQDVIYENNPWIVNDRITEGDVLNLTVLEPKLSVKTVEKLVEQQEVQYDTEVITDDEMKLGEVETITPGVNGMKLVTFSITKVNGQMREEEIINEEMISEPVKAVVKKGTKVILGEGTGNFAWPVVSPNVSSGFGKRWGKLHKGIDITSSKKNILAADNGTVEAAGYKYDYGNYVIIDHKNGYKTLYGHMSKIDVSAGDIVEKGEKIGYMGSTGDSTGVHLHFEIINNGTVENPIKYLNQ
ncbi:Murein hydrolase activator NlpD precursor [Chlamydia abortus]|uniref:Peptidoglycan DD-metalloendopeptidase family protein n=1 Tax=Paenibacillus residui TaxID=629724 RepID=A0ABW3DGU0_9BACL|nr:MULTISPECIES: M23 family metallopeptidase [Paenibacillaceae]SHE15081.1 Murein hydrolase activator NlpD precursor [Chlamydia abortus]